MSALRTYVKNALVLVGASLFMRGVSLAFNAYLSRKIGAEGMGLFTLTMSVYSFAVTFATSGINLAVTRLCAEAMGAGHRGEVRATLRRATVYALLFGGVASLCLFCFATPIGEGLLGDARTVPSLRLLACSMVPIALSSVYSGYFTAMRRVSRNAATQIFEQGVRIALTVYGLLALAPAGLTYACLALVGGSALAEFCSFFFLFVQYLLDRRRYLRGYGVKGEPRLVGRMLRISLPVAGSAYVRSGLVTVEHILIPLCLAAGSGDRGAALASYGVLHSMALPVILFPAAVSSAFAGLLLPEMAECRARGENRRIAYMTARALVCTLLFGVLCAGVLGAGAEEIGLLFYKNGEAGRYIRMLAPVVVIMYLDTVTDCILKGLGYQVYTMGVNIVDSLLSILLVVLLLPRFGAAGYVYVVILAELFNFSLSLARLCSILPLRLPLFRFLFAPVAAVIGATCLVRLLLPSAGTVALLVGHILLAVVLYLILLLLLGSVRVEDIRWLGGILPRAEKREDDKKRASLTK
ncbi:MAG: oligosaccharide flippase family protein [Clostridia bacterium]|nr:oligosaccharide flippase family protein [Clostridia bacterium]